MANRRQFLQGSASTTVLGLAAMAGLLPASAQAAWNKAAFEMKGLNEVVKALGGAAPTESAQVTLSAPEIAENGNVVRVGVASSLPGTTQVAVLVEKNPNTLAAVFDVPEGTDANVATNIKMGQTSNVYALVKAGEKYYYAVKEVKVTLGGCGG
ncbi:thiosulfate oxidation carrier protein SoxY [Caldimonas aquatica]|uniref:Thiosulfate oxidation carrier protein SoxY n=1 Tax=Caldimonas aquatica TaxID=376175 RepID=A0ABY6MMX6_9BURK|nr:thiosulfate oxidation carrier protein SoxY [Schlegelella aquatica]UZD53789.1 thiosulfate oxidation carrier protein SoxY [Schlegelella aquatica]